MSKKMVRVLVVDDSASMRKLIPQMLAVDESIDVVDRPMDGNFCLKKIEELKPTCHARSGNAGNERHRYSEGDHAAATGSGDRVQLQHSTARGLTMKALGGIRLRDQAASQGAHGGDRSRVDREGQAAAECKLKATHVAGSSAEAGEGAGFVGLAQQSGRHWGLDWGRAEGDGVCAVAVALRLSGAITVVQTHAGWIHGHVRAAAG